MSKRKFNTQKPIGCNFCGRTGNKNYKNKEAKHEICEVCAGSGLASRREQREAWRVIRLEEKK